MEAFFEPSNCLRDAFSARSEPEEDADWHVEEVELICAEEQC